MKRHWGHVIQIGVRRTIVSIAKWGTQILQTSVSLVLGIAQRPFSISLSAEYVPSFRDWVSW